MSDAVQSSTRKSHILVLDELPERGRGVAAELSSLGFYTECVATPDATLSRLGQDKLPDLLLLHRRHQGALGIAFLRRLRAISPLPCVFRTLGPDNEWERITALEAGADDYLTAAMGQRELAARLRTVLRRAMPGPSPRPDLSSSRLPHGRPTLPTGQYLNEDMDLGNGLYLSIRRRDAYAVDGVPCHLTSAEFDLLYLLACWKGVPLSREAMSIQVLGRPHLPQDRALDNLVMRVKRKLGSGRVAEPVIKSVRGLGYAFTGRLASQAISREGS